MSHMSHEFRVIQLIAIHLKVDVSGTRYLLVHNLWLQTAETPGHLFKKISRQIGNEGVWR